MTHLAYRDALWPRAAFRRAWEALAEILPAREAARTMVGLLALAHDRGVEADLAQALDALLDADELPSLAAMMHRFTPATTAAPAVAVILPPVTAYDCLLAPAADGVPA